MSSMSSSAENFCCEINQRPCFWFAVSLCVRRLCTNSGKNGYQSRDRRRFCSEPKHMPGERHALWCHRNALRQIKRMKRARPGTCERASVAAMDRAEVVEIAMRRVVPRAGRAGPAPARGRRDGCSRSRACSGDLRQRAQRRPAAWERHGEGEGTCAIGERTEGVIDRFGRCDQPGGGQHEPLAERDAEPGQQKKQRRRRPRSPPAFPD